MLDRRIFSGGSDPTPYVEDVFSAQPYIGTGSTQTITNGLNMAAGSMVWTKKRDSATSAWHFLVDTVRGATKSISSNSTLIETTYSTGLTAFTSSGFTVGSLSDFNGNLNTMMSWGFRKSYKFFDIVKYSGTGTAQAIPHSLGITPGCIIIKRLDVADNWRVYHRDLGNTDYLVLNSTALTTADSTMWNNTSPTDADFTVGTNTTVNASGGTYVAYLFAHDTSSSGIIQCGSITMNASGAGSTNLGWEPQWLLVKRATVSAGSWEINDNIRGLTVNGANYLYAQLTNAEVSYPTQRYTAISSTGFSMVAQTANAVYIYVAIRRGPMKIPTVGTDVFTPVARTGTGANATVTSGFVTDTVIEGNRTLVSAGAKFGVWNRLRWNNYLLTTTTDIEVAGDTTYVQTNPWDITTGYNVGTTSSLINSSSGDFINWMIRRAPGFHDVVCYTGTGSATTVSHNLGAVPELMIVKRRGTNVAAWNVYTSTTGATQILTLNTSNASTSSTSPWNDTAPTASVFTVGTAAATNAASGTYVALLFASCPGVSKIGTFTGNGTSQTINCGFSGGARFVMIKRTDSTGNWLVGDTARGLVSGNDPLLYMNSIDGEVTTLDWLDTNSSGFVVNQDTTANANVNNATYIYLAIA